MRRKYKYKRRLTKKEQRELNNRLILWSIIILFGFWFVSYLLEQYGLFIGIAAAIISALAIFWLIRRFFRRRRLASELGGILKRALEAMDDTAKTYTTEEEANKELVSILKMQGHDATYQFRLNDGRTADARVGNFLIEGKLAPKIKGVDRLIGQLAAYSKHPYKVNVVIYGHLAKPALKRIEDEITERYPSKVFLTYLENPKRRRA